ncbi:MAG: hypothetical protein V4548_08995 [Bacteroidota bacterium]
MKNKLLCFLLFISSISCKNKTIEEYKKELCKFELENVKKYNCKIYNICINSDYAFTDEIYKTLIFTDDEEFDINGGYEVNGNIGEWISEDTLTIYRFDNKEERPKDTIIRISYEKFGNINFKIMNYGATNSGCLNEYSFENYKIKNNKIYFYNIDRILGPILESNITLNLGNLKIETNSDTITKIINERVETNMDLTYHNPDGTYTENLPQIKIITTYYYPKNTIKLAHKKVMDRIFTDIK